MTDFAELGIKVNSSQVKQGAADLDTLSAAAAKAEKQAANFEKNFGGAAKAVGETGKAAKTAASSIDDYVRKLETVAKTNGMSARETKLYELSLRGATKAQLEAADNALKLDEGYKRGIAIGKSVREGFIATADAALKLGAALGAAAAGGALLFNKIADSIAKYQELSEKTGETAENIASLQPASNASGVSLDTVATASIRLTAALSKTDDESKLVAKGIKALGLNFDEFKRMSPVQQLDAVAKAMSGFADGSEKSAAAVAIFRGAGAELLPFFNDLAEQGERQIRLTNEQIKAADDYTKAQAKMRGEITLLAQQIVSASIPAVTDLSGAIRDGIVQILGMGTAADQLKNNNSIGTFAEDGARFLANLLDMADKVVFAFQYVGQTIGATAAIAAAAAQGEFGQIGAIMDAAKEKGEQLLKRPNFAESLDKRIAQRNADAAQRRQEDRGFTPSLPRINAAGLNTDRGKKGKRDNSAAQEAKAQLAFDLEDIRKAQDALSNTIANGEKLLEARRSANLVTEGEYWKQKRDFLIQNDAAQQAGLEKEIARLNQEKLTGKDKIDNDRKILDAQSKLNKLRENAATDLQVLSIKETDALDKIRIKFEQAEAAAQSYVDTISKQNDREIAGLGKGNQARDIDSRRSQREDQFQSRRDQLDSQRRANQITSEEYEKFLAIEASAHKRSLAADEKYWKEKLEKQQDWKVGATEALQNFIDEANNTAKRTETAIASGLSGLSDSITDAIMGDGTKSFKDLGKSVARQFVKGFVDTEILKPAAEFLKDALKGDSTSGSGLSGILSMFGLGGGSKGASTVSGAAGAASSAAAAAAAQSTLATTATGATAALSALATAAASAATAMGGSSLSSALSLANGVGDSGGDALGSLIGMMGWSEGGFTGQGGKYQPAGIVHAGEGVLSQEEVRSIGGEHGFNFLRRMIKRGYADGGFVGSVLGGNLAPQGGDTNNNQKLEVHNHFAAGTTSQTIDQATQKLGAALRKSQRNA
ncbi:phage tail tape measure C-terminal domain-containing protein [Variovorax sp. J22R193]|uniref:phage tail tape measure C-terminal domain-containing protein n=1 Tax=Variovorax fucosicus TaxID=3053517 RepID=UPI002575FAA3|nr:phage tail tape measure C-terminal domain-containing protein [Variovorax sp. J22R193]MDM0041882.1 phage tail tape measure C-terminal domain-containing protein [Variovorax sp. J22R193]